MNAVVVGSKLGRFDILDEIGRGGMSVVYRARDTLIGRDVAIKVLHGALADNPEARERFQQEAVVFGLLDHAHIVKIFECSAPDSTLSYLVTELVEGQPLARLVRGALKPAETALILGYPIIDALTHAHAKGVIHRDLKPENILVGVSGGILKLTDFGIAKLLGSATMTVTGALLGSPAYMAPEYIDGQQPDPRADIFSFGAMLYQWTVGDLPFQGPSPHALLKRISTGEFVPPEQKNPRIPARLARLIRRCMAIRVTDRYQSAAEVKEELGAMLSELDLDATAERQRFFAAPMAYDASTTPILVQRYADLGDAALAAGHIGEALEHFDRVLTDQPDHPHVRALIDRLSRRRRLRRAIAAALTTVVGAALSTWGIGFAIDAWRMSPHPTINAQPPAQKAPLRNVTVAVRGPGDLYLDGATMAQGVYESSTLLMPPGPHVVVWIGANRSDWKHFIVPQTGVVAPVWVGHPNKPTPKAIPRVKKPAPAIPAPVPPDHVRTVTFKPAGQWVTLYVDGAREPVVKEAMRTFQIPLTHGQHRLRFTNAQAQPLTREITVSDSEPAQTILVRLRPLDARLRIRGAHDGAVVMVARRRFVLNQHTRDDPIFVPIPQGRGAQEYEVVVHSRDGKSELLRKRLVFRPGEEQILAVQGKPL